LNGKDFGEYLISGRRQLGRSISILGSAGERVESSAALCSGIPALTMAS
jgi:hypothetical protein